MKIEYININDLKPYEKNPRYNDKAVDYVANSISSFGFKVPLVIDDQNVIICGHTRYLASKRLGIENVPCVIADDLSKEQVKAFRLADNKVAEQAEWNEGLLHDELKEIFNFDMVDFGFEDFDFDFDDDVEPEPKENERVRTIDAYNLSLYDEYDVDGYYDMPIIHDDGVIPSDLVGMNYMLTTDDTNVGIHCFVDDYQFERFWNNPDAYIERMKEFECILSPDFSLYMNMPMSMKIWNTYRSRLLGNYWQRCGIKVIPTISWAETATLKWCFDGIPEGSTVAISTIGVKKDDNAFKVWKKGMDAMIKKIKPKTILVYGGELKYKYPKDIKVIYYTNKVTERMGETSKRAEEEIE